MLRGRNPLAGKLERATVILLRAAALAYGLGWSYVVFDSCDPLQMLLADQAKEPRWLQAAPPRPVDRRGACPVCRPLATATDRIAAN